MKAYLLNKLAFSQAADLVVTAYEEKNYAKGARDSSIYACTTIQKAKRRTRTSIQALRYLLMNQ